MFDLSTTRSVRHGYIHPRGVYALLIFLFLVISSLSGCGGGGSGDTSTPASSVPSGDNNPPAAQPAKLELTTQSANRVGGTTSNQVMDVMRIARGGMLLEGKLRPAAYPSGAFAIQTTTPAPAHSISINRPTPPSGCPLITEPAVITSKGFTITIDYGAGCIDAFDGVSRSGKITIDVSDIEINLADNQLLSATTNVTYDQYTVDTANVAGTVHIRIKTPTIEQWDVHLDNSTGDQTESLIYTATVASSAASDIETIDGSGTYTNPAQEITDFTLDSLQYDLDNLNTPLICSMPIGGSLTLNGTNKAILKYAYPSPGCGFADLTLDGVDQGVIALTDNGTDLSVINSSYGSWIGYVGGNLFGSILITNSGAVAAHDVTLTLKVAGADLPNLYETQGRCTPGDGLSCALDTLNPGESIYLSFQGNPSNAGTSQITATVSNSVKDVNAANDTVNIAVNVSSNVNNSPQQTITRIEVKPAGVEIPIGGQLQFSANVFNDNNFVFVSNISWVSGDTGIMTVDNTGKITAVAAGSATLTASYNGVSSDPVTVTVTSDQIQTVTLPNNDMVYDPHSGKIYASVPSSAGTIGNSITVIDPATAKIERSVYIGSEPGKMALSDDGQYLYVVLNGTTAIRRFDIAAQTAGLQFDLNLPSPYVGSSVTDLAVMPGNAHALAIALSYGYIAIYDDGVARPTASPTGTRLEFSDSPSTIYAESYEFYTLSVNSSGVSLVSESSVVPLYYADFIFRSGLIYTVTGKVVDPGTKAVLGTFTRSRDNGFDSFAAMYPEPSASRVYFMTYESDFTTGITGCILRSYSTDNYLLDKYLVIPQINTQVTNLTRLGATGLAARTADDIFILDAPSVVPASP